MRGAIRTATGPDGHVYVSTDVAAEILNRRTTGTVRQLVADRPGVEALEEAKLPGGGTLRVWHAPARSQRRIMLHLNDLYAYLTRGRRGDAPPALTPAEAAGLLRFEWSPGGRKR